MKAIAESRFSKDVSRLVGFWFKFFSELIDDYVQVLHFVAVVGPPYRLKDVAVRNRDLRVGDQILKNLKLLEPQAYIAAMDRCMVAPKVDFDPVKCDDSRSLVGGERDSP